MKKSNKYYIPMSVMSWDSLAVQTADGDDAVQLTHELVNGDGIVGFMPVYDNLKHARDDYPDAQIVTMEKSVEIKKLEGGK